MAHLWTRLDGGGWQVIPLNGSPVRVPGEDSVWIVPVASADGTWVLVSASARPLRVNGFCTGARLRVLRDRDAIDTGKNDSLFFSTERLAQVEIAPATEGSCVCPRCKQEIEVGSLAVQCPSCSVWHHEADPLKCWTYAETCALCDHSTDVGTGYRFTPEDL